MIQSCPQYLNAVGCKVSKFYCTRTYRWKGYPSVALQLWRAMADWSGCCQMAVQGALSLAKRLSLNLNFSFLNRIRYFSYQVATQLSSRGWVVPFQTLLILQTFPSLHLRYSSFPNPSIALPTSQLILQLFRCFTYVTVHSPTLLSLLLRHKLFTYLTWRTAHGDMDSKE